MVSNYFSSIRYGGIHKGSGLQPETIAATRGTPRSRSPRPAAGKDMHAGAEVSAEALEATEMRGTLVGPQLNRVGSARH